MMGLWLTAVMPGIDRWGKRFFLGFFAVLMLGSFFCLICMVMVYLPVSSAVLTPMLVLECLLIALPVPMLTVSLLHCCKECMRASRLFHTVLGLWIAYSVMVLSSLFSDAFLSVTPDRNPAKGAWYPLMLLPMVVAALLNLVSVIRRRNQLSRNAFCGFLIALLPMVSTLFVQMFIDITPLIDICYVVSGECMYSLILSEQIEQDGSAEITVDFSALTDEAIPCMSPGAFAVPDEPALAADGQTMTGRELVTLSEKLLKTNRIYAGKSLTIYGNAQCFAVNFNPLD